MQYKPGSSYNAVHRGKLCSLYNLMTKSDMQEDQNVIDCINVDGLFTLFSEK